VRLHTDDARHILLASDDTYDVIVSEPPHAWLTGVANLFTQDFYALAASRLRPDGMMAQWLQTYEISPDGFRAILAAFQSVFPEVMVFTTANAFDTVLVGTRRPLRIDLAELERRWSADRTRTELARVGLTQPEHLLACFYLGPDAVRALVAGAPINTDDNLYVEATTPREHMRTARTGNAILPTLESRSTPVETVLRDPTLLTRSRARLEALVEGLRRLQRPSDRYAKLVAELP